MRKFPNITFAFIFTLITILLSSCSALSEAIADTKEVCDAEGEVFLALSENYGEWSEYFENLPPSEANGITINLSGNIYVVRSYFQTNDLFPIISIVTWNTYPVSILGNAGYFYVADDDTSFFSSNYQIRQMQPRIYCYYDSDALNR